MYRKILFSMALSLASLGLCVNPSFATNNHGEGHTPVTLCHATGNGGYVTITIDDDGLHGHDHHEGDIIPAPPEGCPVPTTTTEAPTTTVKPCGDPQLCGPRHPTTTTEAPVVPTTPPPAEDDPEWDCTVNGNRICGPITEPNPADIDADGQPYCYSVRGAECPVPQVEVDEPEVLAYTGDHTARTAALGGALVLLGAAAVVASRRKVK